MKADAVVEALDEVEDGGGGRRAGEEGAAVNELVFKGAPEGFHGGVVIAVAFAAHGGNGL